jgi:hypothetical protein
MEGLSGTPVINFRLSCSPFYYLSEPDECIFLVTLTYFLQSKEDITVFVPGSIFDHDAAFSQERIGIMDVETRELLQIPTDNPTKIGTDRERILVLQPSDQHFCLQWSTDPDRLLVKTVFNIYTTKLNLRDSNIKPNRKYLLSYFNHGISKWFVGKQWNEGGRLETQTGEDPNALEIRFCDDDGFTFQTRLTPPSPPPIAASIWISVIDCDLSGSQPFTVYIDWTLCGNKSIYLLLESKTMSALGLKILDAENGRICGPGRGRVFEDDSRFQPAGDIRDHAFIHLKPGKTFRQQYTFSVQEGQNRSGHSDTKDLIPGWKYKLTIEDRKCAWLYEHEVTDPCLDLFNVESMLRNEPEIRFNSDCGVEFWAIGKHSLD